MASATCKVPSVDDLLEVHICFTIWGFPGGSDGKESAQKAGDPGSGSIRGSGRSPAEENSNPLQYFCLENSRHRGAWWAQATVHWVTELDTTERLTFSHSTSRCHLQEALPSFYSISPSPAFLWIEHMLAAPLGSTVPGRWGSASSCCPSLSASGWAEKSTVSFKQRGLELDPCLSSWRSKEFHHGGQPRLS